MLIRSRRAVMGLSTLGVGAMRLLSGCDCWPPALQAQIDQLHAESQQAAADKALLQNQLNAANKACATSHIQNVLELIASIPPRDPVVWPLCALCAV